MTESKQQVRDLVHISAGMKTSDGDGVKMTRLIGNQELDMIDPFLLLDAFGTDKPMDYIGGFPEHPHRGFETVTYMIAGRMRHKDSMGNVGVIGPGDIQWITAGRGILHSEMPEQEEGLMMGFQLWVNLPASQKMCEPLYQEYTSSQVPTEQHENGCAVRVIAGTTDKGTTGPVVNQFIYPMYLDVDLPKGASFSQVLPTDDHTLIYVLEGGLLVGDKETALAEKQLGVLSRGELVKLTSTAADTRFIFISAAPLNEPVERGGPFVMNTKAEVLQAFKDFQSGAFA
ncbi:pirin family protein [Leucothrix arctica]|uniref:Quercetin 2,3-dioxygenase n=1 Tax=Leucothrix arctica TaxID=1481894 RepID=A0A317CLY1_9GAMM|nr:pirin family protein [Leucothrix arctica]PWQ97310.1 quercetin 2,3-dioxygenase [Leucothrix arctica]